MKFFFKGSFENGAPLIWQHPHITVALIPSSWGCDHSISLSREIAPIPVMVILGRRKPVTTTVIMFWGVGINDAL